MAKARVKKVKRSLTKGKIYIQASFNNTIVSLTDMNGNVMAWSSGGKVGYKGSRKSTPYAAQLAADQVLKEGMDMGLSMLEVYFAGVGQGKDAAVKVFQHQNTVKISGTKDITPHPHNGCKLKKRRGM
jgi:small subunit ribosomal protein S11